MKFRSDIYYHCSTFVDKVKQCFGNPGRNGDIEAEHSSATQVEEEYEGKHGSIGEYVVNSPGRNGDIEAEHSSATQVEEEYEGKHGCIGDVVNSHDPGNTKTHADIKAVFVI